MNKKIKAIKERWKGSKTLEDWSGQTKEDIDYLIAEYERLEKEKLEYITKYIEAAKYNKDMFDENMKVGKENEKLQRIVACAKELRERYKNDKRIDEYRCAELWDKLDQAFTELES